MKLFVDYWLLLTHYMLPNKCLVGWTYFPIISHKYGAGNVLLSTVYVVVPMSFYFIFPIAIALDHSESSQQQFQVARVLVALLNLVDHGKPRQLRDNDRFQCWSWSLSPVLELSLVVVVAFFSHTKPFSNSDCCYSNPHETHLNHAILSSHSVCIDYVYSYRYLPILPLKVCWEWKKWK